MRKNIIVSNRLPVNVTKLENSFLFQSSSGGLATGLKSIHQKSDSLWIGWSGISNDDLTHKDKLYIKKSLKRIDLLGLSFTKKKLMNFILVYQINVFGLCFIILSNWQNLTKRTGSLISRLTKNFAKRLLKMQP